MTLTAQATSHFAHAFERVFILNLPDRSDRRREMTAELYAVNFPAPSPLGQPGSHVSFFPGSRVTELANFPSLGARGCFLSHLAILKHAHREKLSSVLILEDDMTFSPLVPRFDHRLAHMATGKNWDFAYFGHVLPQTPADRAEGPITFEPSRVHVVCAHFYAVRSTILPQLIDWLEIIQTRTPGHPDGGPMHVDGAYNEFRERNPHVTTLIAHPSLGRQRSSRSDIASLKWFDRTPVLKQGVSLLRSMKNRLHA